MTITLEAIKAEQTRIAAMIAEFEKKPAALAFPISIQFPTLAEGEKFVGVIISADGSRKHAVILLPGEADPAGWKKQLKWAESIGGELPDRVESSLLFAAMKNEFKEEWYWTREQYAAYSDCAWSQHFANGSQGLSSTSDEFRARAVRRLAIQ
jgi:hypothetical protein